MRMTEFVTGAGAVASPVRSLWQTDTVGIRAILRCAWALRATGAVAWLQSATWG
jgi:hypothetical protein